MIADTFAGITLAAAQGRERREARCWRRPHGVGDGCGPALPPPLQPIASLSAPLLAFSLPSRATYPVDMPSPQDSMNLMKEAIVVRQQVVILVTVVVVVIVVAVVTAEQGSPGPGI